MKVGDLVRLRDMGMPNQDKTIGIVREIRPLKLEGGAWKSEEWDSVLIYWKEGHQMNDRWVVRGSLEVISESR